MIQLILHLIGDYVTQSDWMALNKTKRSWPALCHATVYSLPFLLIGSAEAVFVIWSTHFLIDRFRLARYVCWAKNVALRPNALREEPFGDLLIEAGLGKESEYLAGLRKDKESYRWANCSETGYRKDTPPFLAVWLMIAADNTLHLAINYAALSLL